MQFIMNICLFGATGRVGAVILKNALMDEHLVKVLVRDPTKLTTNALNLTILKGNVLNESDIAAAINGSDVVISALNTNKSTTLSDSMPKIIRSMKRHGINRIITIGTAGILQSRSEPHLFRFQSSESKRTTTKDAEEHLKAYLLLKASDLEWTIVCPTYLPNGERMGHYRYEREILPENPSSISIYDTADFVYRQIYTNEFIGHRVGLTY